MGTPNHPNDPDLELLRAWVNGDRDSGAALYARYSNELTKFFYYKVSGKFVVEDLVHKTFVALRVNGAKFRGDGPVKGYLFGIARNILFKYFKQRARDLRHVSHEECTLVDLGEDPELGRQQKAKSRLLLKAMRRIPLKMQLTLELKFWQRLSDRDIAQILGIAAPTVRGRISRSYRQLAKAIRELDESGALATPDSQTPSEYHRGNIGKINAGFDVPSALAPRLQAQPSAGGDEQASSQRERPIRLPGAEQPPAPRLVAVPGSESLKQLNGVKRSRPGGAAPESERSSGA